MDVKIMLCDRCLHPIMEPGLHASNGAEDPPHVTVCRHLYHFMCIRDIFINASNVHVMTCVRPGCQRELTNFDFTRLYLTTRILKIHPSPVADDMAVLQNQHAELIQESTMLKDMLKKLQIEFTELEDSLKTKKAEHSNAIKELKDLEVRYNMLTGFQPDLPHQQNIPTPPSCTQTVNPAQYKIPAPMEQGNSFFGPVEYNLNVDHHEIVFDPPKLNFGQPMEIGSMINSPQVPNPRPALLKTVYESSSRQLYVTQQHARYEQRNKRVEELNSTPPNVDKFGSFYDDVTKYENILNKMAETYIPLPVNLRGKLDRETPPLNPSSKDQRKVQALKAAENVNKMQTVTVPASIKTENVDVKQKVVDERAQSLSGEIKQERNNKVAANVHTEAYPKTPDIRIKVEEYNLISSKDEENEK